MKMPTVETLSPVPVPSYLNFFETEFTETRLIYAKKPSIPSNSEFIPDISVKEESIQEYDLTGDPLEVDLGDDDNIEIENIEQTAPMWPKNEMKHFPLSVEEGRRELNKILSNPKFNPGKLPIYVVCNGDDVDKTVLLGAHAETLMACGVHAVGLIELKDGGLDVDDMIKDHYSNCHREGIEIKYLVKIKYNVYGKPLRNLPCQNASMRDFETHASVSVDGISHQPIFKVLEDTKLSMTMDLELIAGHRLLRLNFLWEELHILQKYIDILLGGNLDEDTVLCRDPLDEDKILMSISELLQEKWSGPPPKKNVIDLDNLRHEDFLDRLWILLKQCENIMVLRNSFHFLFEELANSDVHVLNIQDEHSSIAFILNGILKKNIVLPAITLPQCVELLFELGAQKLKFDFQVLLDHYFNKAEHDIESLWQTFYQAQEQKSRDDVRATRVTQYLSASNSNVKIRQLAYLCQLYVGSEFIYIVKEQVHLPKDDFYSFCQHIIRQYVQNNNMFEEFVEVYQIPLCSTSYTFRSGNFGIIQNVSPSRWTMYMTSEVDSTEVTTVYDLSEFPIFPPVFYNYDIPVADKKTVYFMSKMNRIKELPRDV